MQKTENSTVVKIDFPLRGTWKIFHIPGHHQNAYDFVGLDSDTLKYFRKNALKNIFWGGSVEDWHSWAKPIFSPDNGIVVQAEDGWPDRREVGFVRGFIQFFFFRRPPSKITDDPRSIAGNFVTIRRADGIIVFMCHMKNGSVKVNPGDKVNVGDAIGEVGNSGNSLSPHLHLNLFKDTDQKLTGKTILEYLKGAYVPPFVFERFRRQINHDWALVQTETPQKGEKIQSS